MGGQYAPPASPVEPLGPRLTREGFEVTEHDGTLTARRLRRAPDRGLLRLIVPRVVVHVTARRVGVKTAIRPDGLAWLMLVMVTGGVIVEWTMERAAYPRDYPPWFVYGLALVFVVALIAEIVVTGRAVDRAVGHGAVGHG